MNITWGVELESAAPWCGAIYGGAHVLIRLLPMAGNAGPGETCDISRLSVPLLCCSQQWVPLCGKQGRCQRERSKQLEDSYHDGEKRKGMYHEKIQTAWSQNHNNQTWRKKQISPNVDVEQAPICADLTRYEYCLLERLPVVPVQSTGSH